LGESIGAGGARKYSNKLRSELELAGSRRFFDDALEHSTVDWHRLLASSMLETTHGDYNIVEKNEGVEGALLPCSQQNDLK